MGMEGWRRHAILPEISLWQFASFCGMGEMEGDDEMSMEVRWEGSYLDSLLSKVNNNLNSCALYPSSMERMMRSSLAGQHHDLIHHTLRIQRILHDYDQTRPGLSTYPLKESPIHFNQTLLPPPPSPRHQKPYSPHPFLQ